MFGGDEVRMNSYAGSIVSRFGIAASEVSKLLEETRPPEFAPMGPASKTVYSPPKKPSGKKKESEWTPAESSLLTWMTDEPAIFRVVKKYLKADDFSPGSCRSVAEKAYEMLETGTFDISKLLSEFEDEEVIKDATGILQNSAPDIDTPEKRIATLKDLIIKVMERKCELLTHTDDPEKELKVFNCRLEIDRLKQEKLRITDEEE